MSHEDSMKLELEFWDYEHPELVRTNFFSPLQDGPLSAIRGSAPPPRGASYASFRWSRAVRALAFFLVYSKLLAARGISTPSLAGGNGTPAASLDYAIARNSGWLCDMFGSDKRGITLVRRFLHRENAERKRPGPVTLTLQQKKLALEHVSIKVNDTLITAEDSLLDMSSALLRHWDTEKIKGEVETFVRADNRLLSISDLKLL